MAEVLSDFISDASHFHHHSTMRSASSHETSPAEAPYRQRSRSRAERPPPPSPKTHSSSTDLGTPPPSTNSKTSDPDKEDVAKKTSSVKSVKEEPPSPPSSSSPSTETYVKAEYPSQNNFPESSAPYGQDPRREPEDPKLEAAAPLSSPVQTTIPQSARSLDDEQRYGGNTIKVRDLAHIQSFASEEFLSFRGQSGRRRTANVPTLKYEISGMPITDIIEMVAGLLTKITTTNDRQHENLHRPIPSPGDGSNLTGLSSSVLAFHGKNVPSITILSYLSRIHKYCPTTYEVFLSLLVYFDRMTERVNAVPMQALRQDSDAEAAEDTDSRPSTSYSVASGGSDLADSPPSGARSMPDSAADLETAQYTHEPAPRETEIAAFPLSHFFVVDSFNIHRLVIAGVTCASKFFSDVFYTNSRYAKVRYIFFSIFPIVRSKANSTAQSGRRSSAS